MKKYLYVLELEVYSYTYNNLKYYSAYAASHWPVLQVMYPGYVSQKTVFRRSL
jgi:hypothetical protein